MISSPNQHMLQALIVLSRLPEWSEVNKLLDAELASTVERLLDATDPVTTSKLQGRAKLLRELQVTVATAPEVLAKLRLANGAPAHRTPAA